MPAPVSPADPADPADPAVGSPVEPELYLRLVGERTLVARHDGAHGYGRQGDLGSVSSALVATGLLPVTIAVGVVEDYQVAAGLRGDRNTWTSRGVQPAAVITEAPSAPVVAVCRPPTPATDPPVGDERWVWDFHQVVLGDTETVLTVSSESTSPPPWERVQPRSAAGRPLPGHTSTVALADDTGHVERARFTGGGSEGEWSGEYTTSTALSQTTSWLEFDGRRLDLQRPSSRPTVRVEEHGSGGSGERHLRHRLATGHPGPGRGNEDDRPDTAVQALVATGVIEASAPVVAELAAVRAARGTGGLLRGGPLRGGGPVGRAVPAPAAGPAVPAPIAGPAVPAPIAGPAALPAAWASVLRGVTVAGPVGVVPLGVATPVIEGVAAVFRALVSTAEHFTVDTVQVGGESPDHGDHVEQVPSLAWWAQDDLGHWYIGSWCGWSSSDDRMTGQVLYTPPLDPRARMLRLMPTMPARRAVVEVLLPVWGSAT